MSGGDSVPFTSPHLWRLSGGDPSSEHQKGTRTPPLCVPGEGSPGRVSCLEPVGAEAMWRVVGPLAVGVGLDRWRCRPQAGTANALTASLAQGWSLGRRNWHRKVLPRGTPQPLKAGPVPRRWAQLPRQDLVAWASSPRLNLLCAPGAPASTSSWSVSPWQANTPPHGFRAPSQCVSSPPSGLVSGSPPTQPPTECLPGLPGISGPAGSRPPFSARKQAPESPWPPACSPSSHAAGVTGCARDLRGRGRPGLRVHERNGGSADREGPGRGGSFGLKTMFGYVE